MNYYTDALKKYAVFSGRASRKEYWMFFLINVVIGIVLNILISVTKSSGVSFIFSAIYLLYVLALIIPSIAIGVRRLHDSDHSGWWLLIGLIPFLGALVVLYFLIIDGTHGSNRYG